MKVITALSGSTQLKVVQFGRDVDTSLPDSLQPVIESYNLEAGPVDKLLEASDDRVACAHKNGVIATYKLGTFDIVRKYTADARNVVGFWMVDSRFVVIESSGRGRVWDEQSGDLVGTFTLPGEFTVAVNNPQEEDVFMCAGINDLPQVYLLDAESGEVTSLWKAKNPKNTRIDLPEPNLVISAAFIPSESSETYRFTVTTKHGQVRIYDTQQGRPTHMLKISPRPLWAVKATSATLVVGDENSRVAQVNVPGRNDKLRLLANYARVQGSTRAVGIHNHFVAAGGLDRYVRVFELESRRPAGKVYVGAEILDLLFVSDDIEEQEAEDNQVWEQMAPDDTEGNLNPSAKRRRVGSPLSQPYNEKSRSSDEHTNSSGDEEEDEDEEVDNEVDQESDDFQGFSD